MRDQLDYFRENGHPEWMDYTKIIKNFTVENKLYDPAFEGE